MSESRILEREEGDHRAGAWRGKGGFHSEGRQVPRKRERASKESLPRRKKRKHEQVSGRKSSPVRSAVLVSLQVWPNLKWEMRLADEEHALKLT